MQTIVTVQQISHFFQFGWIEFEEFLSPNECASIRSEVEKILKKRLNTEKLTRFDHDRLYSASRDCFRNSTTLQQLYLSQRFASTVISLTNKQPLLLACDQWIPPEKTLQPLHLHDHLSFQNLICGCLLFLNDDQHGRARFFHPDRFPLINDSQLLIAYAGMNSVYIHNPSDPSNGFIKQFGYSFGDRIDARHHPICRMNYT